MVAYTASVTAGTTTQNAHDNRDQGLALVLLRHLRHCASATIVFVGRLAVLDLVRILSVALAHLAEQLPDLKQVRQQQKTWTAQTSWNIDTTAQ